MHLKQDNHMKVKEIRDLQKEESCIEYISKYQATAVVEGLVSTVEIPIRFEIERTAMNKPYKLDYEDECLFIPKIILSNLILESIQELSL